MSTNATPSITPITSFTPPTPSSIQSNDTAATSVAEETEIQDDNDEYIPRYIDVGINLTDPMFSGIYHGKQYHESDLQDVISRAKQAGCKKLLVTGSDLVESGEALKMATEHPGYIFATVGVHPCSSSQFESPDHLPADGEEYLQKLKELAMSSPQVGAFGEIGLDYDRLNYADKDTQNKWFSRQLDIAVEVGLPLFLHSRAAADDFEKELLKMPRWEKLKGGLVHSFTGTKEEMWRLVNAGLYIGINGCSLKTEENLEVVKEVPLDRLMLETDGPWCEIKRTHASAKYLDESPPIAPTVKNKKWKKGCLVKDRNEPALISNVATVIAKVKGITTKEVIEAAWENTVKLFSRLDDTPAEENKE
ncbi:hypothetical protein BZA77DRAFT_334694 [Pyronema omphalodes]|nr:hypothetical protein BZA77DRAFT_334694 [Pyronema omphalodes]